ncbi:flavin prenyltransferase UbiX [Microbulbifer sp. ALW1]|uniref:flavin prenyltransferase UbiX n=1 Tax=Microbulbifer sp. (strain ALW1) TaxID=1516059 RepID=UPI001356EC39|nr:flavin prenyltransferase UbiX [Microbulbifer sp. ALW1]
MPETTWPEITFSKTVTLAITGASGAQYGLRLLQCLLAARVRVWLLLSDAARIVIDTETEVTLPEDEGQTEAFLRDLYAAEEGQLTLFGRRDWFSPVASGTGAASSLVICPASGGTLSAIACGASNNLIERAADVALKERRQLILVPREAPYSEIHLENMLKLTRMGAVVLPASPGFYQKPQTVEDLVDFVVARIMSQLDVEQSLLPPWGDG